MRSGLHVPDQRSSYAFWVMTVYQSIRVRLVAAYDLRSNVNQYEMVFRKQHVEIDMPLDV